MSMLPAKQSRPRSSVRLAFQRCSWAQTAATCGALLVAVVICLAAVDRTTPAGEEAEITWSNHTVIDDIKKTPVHLCSGVGTLETPGNEKEPVVTEPASSPSPPIDGQSTNRTSHLISVAATSIYTGTAISWAAIACLIHLQTL